MISPYSHDLAKGRPRIQLLDTNGDGSGTYSWGLINASPGAPVDIKLTTPAGYTDYVMSMTLSLFSSSTQALTNFSTIPELTNGVIPTMLDPSGVSHPFDVLPITKNCCWARYGCTYQLLAGTSTTHMTVTLNWPQVFGSPERINPGWSYALRMQDDLTGIGDINKVVCSASFIRSKNYD